MKNNSILCILLIGLGFMINGQNIPSLQEIAMKQIAPTLFQAIKNGDVDYLEQLPFHMNESAENIGKKVLLNQPLHMFNHTFSSSLIGNPIEHITTKVISCVAISPNSRFIAFGHEGGSITLFDTIDKDFMHFDLYNEEIRSLEWNHHSNQLLIVTDDCQCYIYDIEGELYDLTIENEYILSAFWVNNGQNIHFLIGTDDSKSFHTISIQNLADDNKEKAPLSEDIFPDDCNLLMWKTQNYVIFTDRDYFYIFNRDKGSLTTIHLDLQQDMPELIDLTENPFTKTLWANFQDINVSYHISVETKEIEIIQNQSFPIGWIDESRMILIFKDHISLYNYTIDQLASNHFSSDIYLAGNESNLLAILQKEPRSYSLKIVHNGLKNIRLSATGNRNIQVHFTPYMGALCTIEGIENTYAKISIYDTSLTLGADLTLKQLVLIELMVRHKKMVPYLMESEFWKDAYESLPERISSLIKEKKSSSCTIL